MLSLVFLLAAGLSLLLFVCVHYQNWWGLFVLMACSVAVVVPNVCFSYDPRHVSLLDIDMEEEAFVRCRELGWSVGIIMWLFSYAIPVLAWYNSGLRWDAVLQLYACITFFGWSFLLWRRVPV